MEPVLSGHMKQKPGIPRPAYLDHPRGHVWRTDSDGYVLYLGYADDEMEHGGPECERCEYWFCQHCSRDQIPAEDCALSDSD